MKRDGNQHQFLGHRIFLELAAMRFIPRLRVLTLLFLHPAPHSARVLRMEKWRMLMDREIVCSSHARLDDPAIAS